MNVRKRLTVLLVVVALSVSATSLHAQGFSVFVMGTGSSLFDKRNYSVLAGQFGSAYKTGGGFTLGGELPVTKIFGLEAAYSLARNDLNVTNFTLSPAFVSTYSVRNQKVSGDVIAHAPISLFRFRPYLVGGLEFDRFTPLQPGAFFQYFNGYSNVSLPPDDMVGLNYGGGLDLKLVSRITFRIDVRDHLMASPKFGLPSSSSNGPVFPVSGFAQNVQYSAGLVFHLRK